MFVVADMHAHGNGLFEVHVATLALSFGRLEIPIEHVHRPAEYSSKSFRLWNLIVRPLYNGRPVAINGKSRAGWSRSVVRSVRLVFQPRTTVRGGHF